MRTNRFLSGRDSFRFLILFFPFIGKVAFVDRYSKNLIWVLKKASPSTGEAQIGVKCRIFSSSKFIVLEYSSQVKALTISAAPWGLICVLWQTPNPLPKTHKGVFRRICAPMACYFLLVSFLRPLLTFTLLIGANCSTFGFRSVE